MALNFERGIEALKQSERQGGGFRPFTPNIRWKDGEEKYIAIPNPVDVIPKIHVHEFIEVEKRERADGSTYPVYEEFLDRTTPAIGEDNDPLSEKGSPARERNIALGVELEPVMAPGRNGRPRPKGFAVKTIEFNRKVRDENGEDTGDTETVVAPEIGFVLQSPYNFYGYLGSYNESDGPHEEIAFRIKRRGTESATAYDWTPYEDQEIDWSNLIDNLEGISYLREDAEQIRSKIAELNDFEAAQFIANFMLEKRLEELADIDRYHELTDHIEEIKSKYGNNKKSGGNKSGGSKPRPQRAQQRTRKPKEEASEPEVEAEPEAEPERSEQERLDQFEELRAKAKRAREKAAA